MIALVLAGGELSPDSRLRRLAREAGLIVAADSGLAHAPGLGVTPDLIIGDFDSVSAADLERFPDVPRMRHPADKGQLDLELAAEAALWQGATRLRLMGLIGRRCDQSLAGLLIAARLHRDEVPTTAHTSVADIHFLSGEETLVLDAPPGTVFSLLSLSNEARVSVSGARYPLSSFTLPFGVGQGVSNVTEPGVEIRLTTGLLSTIVERKKGG